MGSAIIDAWITNEIISPDQLLVFDKKKRKDTAYTVLTNDSDIPRIMKADIVLLAVKPQSLESVTYEYAEHISNSLIITILAGTSVERVKAYFPGNKVIRWMPNLAVRVQKGVVGVYGHEQIDEKLSETHAELVSIFNFIKWCKQESEIDLITAICGSGPGFYYNIANSFELIARNYGYSQEEASIMTRLVFTGTAELVEGSDDSFKQLEQKVASKRGTTEAGLSQMEPIHEILHKAVEAAVNRARELSQ